MNNLNDDNRVPIYLHTPQMFWGAAFDYVAVTFSISVICFVATQGNFVVLAVCTAILHIFAVLLTEYDTMIVKVLSGKIMNKLFLEHIGTAWKNKSYDPF